MAPEHISDNVLSKMGKPDVNTYNAFCREFEKMNEKLHKDQYIVPYLMSSHPGSTMKDAIALAEYIRDLGYMPEQVQDFYPTPGTISTCMYYTGLDPTTLLIQYRDPQNYALVKEALVREGRQDLIGFGEQFLIPPRQVGKTGKPGTKKAVRPAGRPAKTDRGVRRAGTGAGKRRSK